MAVAGDGASKDYNFGPKNNWRRTIWNEVLRRTKGREKSEPILYLAGPEDHDRRIAVEKRVPSHNLIALDHHGANVEAVRRGQGLAVKADALDALWSWPVNRPVCAVMLDFCSGLEYTNMAILDAFQRPPLQEATIMLNFMRGRDPWANDIRAGLEEAGLLNPVFKMKTDVPDGDPVKVADPKSRAVQFLMVHAWDTLATTQGMGSGSAVHGDRVAMPMPQTEEARDALKVACSLLLTNWHPKFMTYRSGTLVFDSVVLDSPHRGMAEMRRAAVTNPALFKGFLLFAKLMGANFTEADVLKELNVDPAVLRGWSVKSIQRKLSASLAIRTGRMNRVGGKETGDARGATA